MPIYILMVADESIKHLFENNTEEFLIPRTNFMFPKFKTLKLLICFFGAIIYVDLIRNRYFNFIPV